MEKKKTPQKQKGYDLYLEKSNIGVGPILWVLMAIVITIALGVVLLMVFPKAPTIGLITFVSLPLLIIGFPIIIKEMRDGKIADAIPDVFEELATSLRAGATVEQALLDLTKIQSGPLIDELKISLNDMEGGYSFEESLENLMSRVDVVLLKRILKIVIDGRKAGGELADILDSVASDARDLSRLQRERASKTLMYIIFIFAAGGCVAPLIFGFVTEIGGVVANVGSAAGTNQNPLEVILFSTPLSILWLYLLIECFISGVMMAFVKGVKVWRGIMFYSLSMALIATIVFELSKMVAGGMLKSSSGGVSPI